MWENFIEWLGFNNVYQGGQIAGFQFKIHIPYYRGVFLSVISDGFSVKVDEESFPLDKVSLKIGDRVIPWSQVDASYDVFWVFGELATVIVEKPGGLTPGLHKVECGMCFRKSYGALIDPEGLLDRNLPKSWDEYVYKPIEQLQVASQQMTLVM
jgi:hypothetical protein